MAMFTYSSDVEATQKGEDHLRGKYLGFCGQIQFKWCWLSNTTEVLYT